MRKEMRLENKMSHFMQAILTGADTVAWYTAIVVREGGDGDQRWMGRILIIAGRGE
jgi:hypothetical protein